MEAPDVVLIFSALGNVLLIAYNIYIGFRKAPAERSSLNAQASVDYAEATQKWIDTVYDLNEKLQKRNEEYFALKQENDTLKTKVTHLEGDVAVLREQVLQLQKAVA